MLGVVWVGRLHEGGVGGVAMDMEGDGVLRNFSLTGT